MSNEVTRKVKVATLIEPANLTLTKKPASQVGFKVIRTDKEQEMAEGNDVRVKRTRVRRSMGAMTSVIFPAGTTEEAAKQAMQEFGLSDYNLKDSGETIVALRSDLQELPSNCVTVGIGNGLMATIQRAEPPAPVAGEAAHIAVVSMQFDKTKFPEESDVMSWIERHDIDFLENGVKNGDTAFTVCRTDTDAETREVLTEDGVTFVIARADVQDVPVSVVEVVSEAAYGNWGWGQLDFAAAMADTEFSEMAREGLYKLEDVLRNIMFYSALPVSVRKELVSRALSQFGDYIGGMMDSLPAKVVLVNRSILESKEKQMSKEENNAQPETVTRADVIEIVAAAVEKALAAQPVQRSEAATEVVAAAAVAEVKTDPALAAVEAVTRSMEAMSNSFKAMTDTMNARLEKIEGSTVLRSDSGDVQQVEVKRNDVFAGVFGNLKQQ